jgi:DNA-binding SARP family transcriptional activator
MIYIELFGDFGVFVDKGIVTDQICKSRKGTALIQYLMLSKDEPVPNTKLFEVLWPEEESSNPENALKTLVSRMRVILNGVAPGFGDSIVSTRGAYQWKMQLGMTVDYYEIMGLIKKLMPTGSLDDQLCEEYRRLALLYKGDLLQGQNAQCECAVPRAVLLHGQYLKAIYHYVDLLKKVENFEEIVNVTRIALDIDAFDERLHLELLNALTKTDRNNEALQQYKHITNLHYRYLGVQPPTAIQDFYKQIMQARSDLEFNMEAIRSELLENNRTRGAFICEYAVFNELYNLQIRNLERLGVPMFLALIMVNSVDGLPLPPLNLDEIMQGLLEILRANLRKGDAITHYLPAQCALLLPTVNHETGAMVIERIKRVFYQKYPNSNIIFNYRIGPLGSENA